MTGGQRTLSQQSAVISVVRSAKELEGAVKAGDKHIEIQRHLDLASIAQGPNAALQVKSSTKSIRGNCDSKPSEGLVQDLVHTSAGLLLPLQTHTCLLRFPGSLFSIIQQHEKTHDTLFENLYLRYAPKAQQTASSAAPGNSTTDYVASAQTALSIKRASNPQGAPLPRAWLVNTIIQGTGEPSSPYAGLRVEGQLHAKDSTFTALGPTTPSIFVARDNSSAAFHTCTFQKNAAAGSTYGLMHAADRCAVLVNECWFRDNSFTTMFSATSGDAAFFADVPFGVLDTVNGTTSSPLPVDEAGAASPEFLGMDDGDLPATRQELATGRRARPYSGDFLSEEDVSNGVIAAVVISSFFLLLGIVVGVWSWRARHRPRPEDQVFSGEVVVSKMMVVQQEPPVKTARELRRQITDPGNLHMSMSAMTLRGDSFDVQDTVGVRELRLSPSQMHAAQARARSLDPMGTPSPPSLPPLGTYGASHPV